VNRKPKKLFLAFVVCGNLSAQNIFACAACYGKSDSAMALGMNWGIFALLGVVGSVLAGIAGFFVFLVKRAEKISAEDLNLNKI